MTLRVYLLGPVQVSRDNTPIDIPGYKPLALLAYLLVTGKAHSRQHLVDLLFDNPDDPRASLRWTLSKLRQAIGPEYLLADRQEVTFNFDSDYWLDVTAFEAGKLDLYRGDFLEGLYLRDAYRFEDWAFFERERLRASYQSILEQRLGEVEGQGNDLAMVKIAHQLLRLDNLREDWYRALMVAYARQGQREATLAQFELCRQILQAELGVEPVAETKALMQAIQQGHFQPHRLTPERNHQLIARRFMIDDPVKRQVPTSLVGRTGEMATLRHAWQRALAGKGQIILVEGEPGIGKTRLIEELLAEAGAEALVLRAKCPELQEPLAYTLFVDPLRDALAGERLPGLSDTWLAEVSRLLPELRDRYPNLPQLTPLEPVAERRRLFDAICTTLLAWTKQQPLIFFVDDLQWADSTSLALLNHLSGSISAAPVLLTGAYRLHEVGPQHPLQVLRRDWTRAGMLTSLALQPLSDQAVNDLLQELTTWKGEDASFGALIYRETSGNPLFVIETIASLRDEGRLPQDAEGWRRDFRADSIVIPTQVQTIIEARLDRLDDLSRQIITAAAVMRSGFEAELVQEVSGRSEWETMEGLERLLASGLLVEQNVDRFTFSHDKIREVAYGSLSQLRRKLLHRRMAETLEARHRGQETAVAGRLAYHYERAGIEEKALDYYLRAAHLARAQYAHEAAISYYQKALALLKEQGDHERASRTLMQLGLTYHQAFDFQGAHQAYEEGFALWQRAGKAQPDTSQQTDRRQPAASLSPAPHALRTMEDEPSSVDPALAADRYSINIAAQLFSGLVAESRDVEVVPDVAGSWEILEGGRKYIFHLREDVRWCDGKPVTAADFEYAWKRAIHPATGSEMANLLYDLQGARAFHQGEIVQPESVGVFALDKHTLAVALEGPTGYFLHLLTQPITFPVPQHVLETYGEAWTAVEHIVSNGPFKLTAWKQGEAMILARNEDYHGRFMGNIERVELLFGLNQATTWAMYEAGHLDLAHLPFLPEDQAWRRHTEECLSTSIPRTFYLSFDMSRPPFSDLRVRQALILATDREQWTGSRLEIFGAPAMGGFIPSGMAGHSTNIGLPYDPTQARRLLAEAGYPEGRHFPLVDWLVAESLEPLADELQTQWQQNLGIRISWNTAPWEMLTRLAKERPSLALGGWVAEVPDPDSFLRTCLQQSLQGWQNEAYETLIERARRSTDQRERIKLYQQADRILIEAAVVMPVTYGRWHVLVKPWLKQYSYTPTWSPVWKDCIIEPYIEEN